MPITPNLDLNKPSVTEQYDIKTLNDNFDILDNSLLRTQQTLSAIEKRTVQGNLGIGISQVIIPTLLPGTTDVTSINCETGNEWNKYALLLFQIGSYNNIHFTAFMTSEQFSETGTGRRIIAPIFTSGGTFNGTVEIYKNGNNAMYVKCSTANFSIYRLTVIGILNI